jgi:hypothetical protein
MLHGAVSSACASSCLAYAHNLCFLCVVRCSLSGCVAEKAWHVQPLILAVFLVGMFQVLAGAAADLATNTLQEDAFRCAAKFAGSCICVLLQLHVGL